MTEARVDGGILDFLLLIGSYPIASLEVSDETGAFLRKGMGPRVPGINQILSDGTTWWHGRSSRRPWAQFPSPQEFWCVGGRAWTDDDPRLLDEGAGFPIMGPLSSQQCLALARMLDAQCEGQRRIHAVMPFGAGGTTVALEVMLRVLDRRKSQRALILASNAMHAAELHHRLSAAQTRFRVMRLDNMVAGDNAAINIGSVGYFMAHGWARLAEIDASIYDLIVVPDARSNDSMNRILDYFEQANVIGVMSASNVTLDFRFGDATYIQQAQDVLDAMLRQPPPPGMRTVRLRDIARIGIGLGPVRPGSEDSTQEVVIIRATDITRDGEGPLGLGSPQAVSVAELRRGELTPRELMPGDIIIPRITNVMVPLRVGIVGERGSYASRSVLQIRVTAPDVAFEDVALYLRSDRALFYLRVVSARLQTSLRIMASDLADMPVFVPVGGDAESPRENALNAPFPVNVLLAGLAVQLSKEVLPLLATASSMLDPDPEQMRKIAEDLRKIASIIVPRTLDERILLEYPTPISLAWRRYRDARFNRYEQVLRLRDAFEAAAFFVFNLTLADVLRRLDEAKYRVGDRGARKAYKGASMAQRIDFVEAVWGKASAGSTKELFAPQLVDTSFIDIARRLQRDFRNRLSHTATASESRLRVLLEEFGPEVESLMGGLACLADIQMVRIPSFFFREGVMVRRIEVYRGVVPQVDEQVLGSETPLAVEHDHLVLLDDDERCLDLYPLYQLVEAESTHHERHIFFMKSVHPEKKLLMGESAHLPIELALGGYAMFTEILGRKGL